MAGRQLRVSAPYVGLRCSESVRVRLGLLRHSLQNHKDRIFPVSGCPAILFCESYFPSFCIIAPHATTSPLRLLCSKARSQQILIRGVTYRFLACFFSSFLLQPFLCISYLASLYGSSYINSKGYLFSSLSNQLFLCEKIHRVSNGDRCYNCE